MGRVVMPAGGGGGILSDELSARAIHVLEGLKFVGYDTNDEIGTGTMKHMANYPTAYLTTADRRRVHMNGLGTDECWTVANSDGQLRSLIAIPVAGYYDVNDIIAVSAARMAVAGGLTADKMPVGKSAFGIDGTLAVQSAISFSAAALSARTIRISWTNPTKGPWEGVFIQMSTTGYPGTSGGTRIYTGTGVNTAPGGNNYVDIDGLDITTTYYFTCTSYCNALGWGTSHNVSATTTGLILYWYGDNRAGITNRFSGEESYYNFREDYIYINQSGSSRDAKTATPYDIKPYTKLKVTCDYRYKSYNYAWLMSACNSPWPMDTSQYVEQGVIKTYTFDVTNLTTFQTFMFGMTNNGNSGNAYSINIYAIWFE